MSASGSGLPQVARVAGVRDRKLFLLVAAMTMISGRRSARAHGPLQPWEAIGRARPRLDLPQCPHPGAGGDRRHAPFVQGLTPIKGTPARSTEIAAELLYG